MRAPRESYSSKNAENTRVKVKQRKKTVGITLPKKLVERARKHKLNISRITEQSLTSVLDWLETQNTETAQKSISTAVRLSLPQVWCSGRDLNPGRRLSPLFLGSRGRHTWSLSFLTWLYYRSVMTTETVASLNF